MTRRCLLLVLTALLSSCSVSEVEVRLNEDLSGTFTTILAASRENENCQSAPKALQDLVAETVKNDPGLVDELTLSPYNDGKLNGVQTTFDFGSPSEIPLRIGQLQRLNLSDRNDDEENEAQKQLRELLATIDSLPVNFRALVGPPRLENGRRIWTAEFRGDPGVLLDLNVGDDPTLYCSPNTIKFRVVMPAEVIDYSPKVGRVAATKLGIHTVQWVVPKDDGEVVLSIRAAEPEPTTGRDWLDAKIWIALATLATALLGVLATWKKYRSEG